MRLHALLVLPLLALHAHAASIPGDIVPELEAKLSEAVKEVLDRDADSLKDDLADQELLDRVNAVDNISGDATEPSVAEDVPTVQEGSEIKRVELDLKNPGIPQIQRHDAQNPEGFDEAKLKEASVSHSVAEAQTELYKGLVKINEKAQEPVSNDIKISVLQYSLKELQENFAKHIRILNDAAKESSKQESSAPLRSALGAELEFNAGSETADLSQGVAQLKADSATPDPAAASNPLNGISAVIQTIVNGLQQLQDRVQNLLNPNSSSTTGQSTNFLQGITNFWSGQQQSQQPGSTGTSNFPIIENVQNSINSWFNPGQGQTSQTSDPPKETSSSIEAPAPSNTLGGTNDPTRVGLEVSNPGPIRQMLLKNPVFQGIAGTVQKVQSSVTHVESAKDSDEPATKGHGGGRPGSEYSNDSDVIGLASENLATNDENLMDATVQPTMAEEQKDIVLVSDNKEESVEATTKVDYYDNKENPTEETVVLITNTEVSQLQPVILVRTKEENIENEDSATIVPTTDLPTLKEDITTVQTDLMLGDEPKVEDIISTENRFQEEETETTLMPVTKKELDLNSEAIPTTEILMRDDFVTENTPNVEVVQTEVSGTEMPETNVVTNKEELLPTFESVKIDEPATTLHPSVEIQDRNQETERENMKEQQDIYTTIPPAMPELVPSLEVLPMVEESKKDEIDSVPTTEVPKMEEDNKESQVKKEKHKVKSFENREKKRSPKLIRRRISRTSL